MIAAQKIKDLRLQHHYTQNYLADYLSISQKTYSNMECGKSKVSLANLQKLAQLYKMDIMLLIESISRLEIETIKTKITEHPEIADSTLLVDVNSNLPFELIHQLKARIEDLNSLVASKNMTIQSLYHKIKTLEKKTP
jgi:transcriptional regulator with XRE-family HTH domain